MSSVLGQSVRGVKVGSTGVASAATSASVAMRTCKWPDVQDASGSSADRSVLRKTRYWDLQATNEPNVRLIDLENADELIRSPNILHPGKCKTKPSS